MEDGDVVSPAALAAAAGPPPGLGARPKAAPAASSTGVGTAGGGVGPLSALDPAVVASARAAGISDADLVAFDAVVGAGSRRLHDPPAARAVGARNLGPGDEAPEGDRIDRLVDALTALVGGGQTQASHDPLERALSSLDGGARVGEPIGARRGAAARLALRRALVQDPAHFSRYVEEQLAGAFTSRAVAGARPTLREYIELRSRIGNHRPTISWA